MPAGSETLEVDNILKEIRGSINEIPEIEAVFTSAGGGGIMGLGGGGSGGSINVLLKDLDERDRSAKEISDEIRTIVKEIPGAEISVSESSMMMMGMSTGAISISIKGDDLDTLNKNVQKYILNNIQNIIRLH